MSSTAEASFLGRQLALPAPAGDPTKAAISRAQRVLKTWTWNRMNALALIHAGCWAGEDRDGEERQWESR